MHEIEGMAAKTDLLDGGSAGAGGDIAPNDWVAFELGHYDLATTLSRVAPETLRNTQGKPRVTRS